MLDSGGFQFIRKNGRYPITPEEYLQKVDFFQPDFFVIQDWMCEPDQVKRTGLTVREHIRRTVENYLYICELLVSDYSHINSYCMPVIQGWELEDYHDCLDLYADYGLLTPYMAVGSVCRRNQTSDILKIIQSIKGLLPDLKIHGLGVKKQVVDAEGQLLYSADSAAAQFMHTGPDGKWITTKTGLYRVLQDYYYRVSKVEWLDGEGITDENKSVSS